MHTAQTPPLSQIDWIADEYEREGVEIMRKALDKDPVEFCRLYRPLLTDEILAQMNEHLVDGARAKARGRRRPH